MAEPNVKRIRTCIGCQRQAGKTALKRIVRCPDASTQPGVFPVVVRTFAASNA